MLAAISLFFFVSFPPIAVVRSRDPRGPLDTLRVTRMGAAVSAFPCAHATLRTAWAGRAQPFRLPSLPPAAAERDTDLDNSQDRPRERVKTLSAFAHSVRFGGETL